MIARKLSTSREEIFANDDVYSAHLYKCGLAEIVEEARRSLPAFFNFVMREEHTRDPIHIMPHQLVALEFIQAHDRCVNIWPVGSSKTFLMVAVTLWMLGKNPSVRGAIVSATQAQAAKVVSVVRDYIETSAELRLVFPDLTKSLRESDPWTQVSITIKRPPGIKDPSLVAHGIDSGSITGSRLSWILIDDLLNAENTATAAQRQKVFRWLASTVRSRLDPIGAKVVFTNSPWHPKDAVHLMTQDPPNAPGWACLRMDIEGNIFVKDDFSSIDPELLRKGLAPPRWDSLMLRPKSPGDTVCRLVAHDPDPNNEVPLWPERYPRHWIERERREHLPHEFNRLYMTVCRDESTAMCKQDYVNKALEAGRREGFYRPVSDYIGTNVTFTGVDLAISPGEEHDDTAFVTIECRPDGTRVLLDVECGQWAGPEILDRLFEKQKAFNSVVRVENNGAQQYLIDFCLRRNKSLPIKAHTTGRTKAHPEHGVPGIFLEFFNGAWVIPNGKHGELDPHVKRLLDACLEYAPGKHTDDALMACWFAVEQAKEWGFKGGKSVQSDGSGSVGAAIMSR